MNANSRKISCAQRTLALTELVEVRVARHEEELMVIFILLRREGERRRDVGDDGGVGLGHDLLRLAVDNLCDHRGKLDYFFWDVKNQDFL